jgi:phosphoglucomutase/phosphomannomutase
MDALRREIERGFAGLAAAEDIRRSARDNLAEWLGDPRLADYLPYIGHLAAAGRFDLLLDSFWRMIPFGTGGRRGPVGAGPNRINPRTVALSVQGHCDYLREIAASSGAPAVVVAHDVRVFGDLRGLYRGVDGILAGLTSRDLARQCAETYAANGVTAWVVGPLAAEGGAPPCTDRFISTPELSFLIRELGAAGGLNVSASHNHPDDNGGKFYNRQGGQEIPPHDERLLETVERVREIRSLPYLEARTAGSIRFVPPELHERYLEVNEALSPTASRTARVAFTPLCGTGSGTVLEALERLGYRVHTVPEQTVFDGSFSTVPYRIGNPEVSESMGRLAEVALEHGCHVGFATDPDADRLGLIVPAPEGGMRCVGGNEIGALLLQSILSGRRRAGTLPARPIFINTLVTTSLQRVIARRHGCQVIGDLMVGFKYMGDVLCHLERGGRFPAGDAAGRDRVVGTLDDFVFTTEESHGYLLTHRIRDKDACGAAVQLAGLASELADTGRTFAGLLRDIFRVYGYHRNLQRSLVLEGIAGLERIRRIQRALREAPPTEIAGLAVTRFVDCQIEGGPLRSSTDAASRDVLLFELGGDPERPLRLIIRPSGTEPKTKLYVEVPSSRCLGGILDDATPATLARLPDDELDGIIRDCDRQAREIGDAFVRHCLGPAVLGDAFGAVPDEALLVSDLVPVEQRLRLVTAVLPGLVERLAAGAGEAAAGAWLDAELRPFGEGPRGLVRTAALAWLERAAREGDPRSAALDAARRVLGLGGQELSLFT